MSENIPKFQRKKLSWGIEAEAQSMEALQCLYTTEWREFELPQGAKDEHVLCIGLGACPFNVPSDWLYARISASSQFQPMLAEGDWQRIILISDGREQSVVLGLQFLQWLGESAVLSSMRVTFLRRQRDNLDGGLIGLASTARLEWPNLRLNLVSFSAESESVWQACCVHSPECDFQVNDEEKVLVPKLVSVSARNQTPMVSPDQSYVISGGAGELGLVSAELLLELGARHLVLLNRSNYSQSVPQTILRLQERADVRLIQCDITNSFSVIKVFRELRNQGFPGVAGVIHTAGVLTDGMLETQTQDMFESNFNIKVNGAIHLMEATKPTDFFIGYSSLAGVLGSPAQASYAAANSALSTLTATWKRHGVPAVSIHWGVWSSGGMAVRTGAVKRAEQLGLGSIDLATGQAALRTILANINAHESYVVSPFVWDKFNIQSPLLELFIKKQSVMVSNMKPLVGDESVRKRIQQAVYEAIGEIVEDGQPLMENGLNSLGGMSLRNQIAMDMNVTLPSAFIVECPDINSMVRYVQTQMDSGPAQLQKDSQPDSALPVLVIGAGIGGLGFARQLELAGISVQIVDKQSKAGGVWNVHANTDSKLQIDSPAYDFDSTQLPLENDHSWKDAFPKQTKILADSNAIAAQFKIPVLFNTEVLKVQKEGDQQYRVTFITHGLETQHLFSGVVSMTGGLHQPTRLTFPGEEVFVGKIAYGIGDDIEREYFNNAKVVIVGHGAFALENMRTALEHGAKHVTILCRRRNLVMSTFCNWLLNSTAGVMSVNDVQAVMRPFYAATGVNIDDLPSFIYDDKGGLVLDQTTVPPGSDLFFLAQMAGKLSIVVDEIEHMESQALVTKKGARIDADIVLKCLGFETESKIPQLFGGQSTIQGLWINRDPNLLTYNDGAQVPRKVKTLLCSSYGFFVQVFAKSYIHFRRNPDLFESALRRIENESRGNTVAERVFVELWDFIEPAKRLTAQRTQEQLPFDLFMVERETEWKRYAEMLGGGDIAMWPLLQPALNILARRHPNALVEQRTEADRYGNYSVFTTQKKRVLFLHGQGTDARLARSLLERTGWLNRTDFEFTIPDAPFVLDAFTNEEQLQQVGLDGLVDLGIYDKNARYREWRAGFETLWAEFHGLDDPTDRVAARHDWFFALGYLRSVLDQYGPFDGIAGFCEGAAILNAALHLERFGANHGLSEMQFFIAMSPWHPPLFEKDGLFNPQNKLNIPMLQIVGDNDMPVFIDAAPKFAASYLGSVVFHHPGQHVYPTLNKNLSDKVNELLEKSERKKVKWAA